MNQQSDTVGRHAAVSSRQCKLLKYYQLMHFNKSLHNKHEH